MTVNFFKGLNYFSNVYLGVKFRIKKSFWGNVLKSSELLGSWGSSNRFFGTNSEENDNELIHDLSKKYVFQP